MTINKINIPQIKQNDQGNSRKTYEAIIDHIKSDIITGKLHTGQKLPPERELAKQFGVSRTSIREALRTLEILGVTESIQGSGNFIAANVGKSLVESMSMMFLLQQIDVLQINQLREALEIKATILAVDHITAEEINDLEEIIKKMSTSNDEKTNAALDKQLHYTIAAASKNLILVQILNILSELIEIHIKDRRSEFLSDEKNTTSLLAIHEALVNGIKNRNRDETYNAISKHFAIIEEYYQMNHNRGT